MNKKKPKAPHNMAAPQVIDMEVVYFPGQNFITTSSSVWCVKALTAAAQS